MKRLALFVGVVLILFSYSTAFGEQLKITIESYVNPSLGVKITDIPFAGTYDPNDTAHQLEMSHQAILFAMSEDGWDLESHGSKFFRFFNKKTPQNVKSLLLTGLHVSCWEPKIFVSIRKNSLVSILSKHQTLTSR